MAVSISGLADAVRLATPEILLDALSGAYTLADFNRVEVAGTGKITLLDQDLNFTIQSSKSLPSTNTATDTLSDTDLSTDLFYSRNVLDFGAVHGKLGSPVGASAEEETAFYMDGIRRNIVAQVPLTVEDSLWNTASTGLRALIEASGNSSDAGTAEEVVVAAFASTDDADAAAEKMRSIIDANPALLSQGGKIYTSRQQIHKYAIAVNGASNGWSMGGADELREGEFRDPVFGVVMVPIHNFTGDTKYFLAPNNLYMGVSTPSDIDAIKVWYSDDDNRGYYQVAFHAGAVVGKMANVVVAPTA